MLKLYKNTIKITSITAVGCFLLSVLFDFISFPHCGLLQNIFIGAFCSLIVVIITTILQYRAEHVNVLKDYSSNLRLLIFNLSLINADRDNPPNQKQYEHFYSEFDKLFHSLREYNVTLVWFSNKKSKLQSEVFKCFSFMWGDFVVKGIDSHKGGVDVLIGHEKYQDLINACIEFLPDGFDKDSIMGCHRELEKIETLNNH